MNVRFRFLGRERLRLNLVRDGSVGGQLVAEDYKTSIYVLALFRNRTAEFAPAIEGLRGSIGQHAERGKERLGKSVFTSL